MIFGLEMEVTNYEFENTTSKGSGIVLLLVLLCIVSRLTSTTEADFTTNFLSNEMFENDEAL